MRLVSLLEDSEVYRQHVDRSLYLLFKNRHSDFLQMIKDQTDAFWVGFTITLQDVLGRERLTEMLLGKKTDFSELFFIYLHDLLVSKRPERVSTFVSDVVALARYSKFMKCFEVTQPKYHAISTDIDGMASFERLFGDRRDEQTPEKVYQTLGLHIFAVGGLLTVFKLWLMALPCDRVDWAAPPGWAVLRHPSPFYCHVKKRWGRAILDMLPTRGTISWWDSDSVVTKEIHRDSQMWQIYFIKDDRSANLQKLEFNDRWEKPLMFVQIISVIMERACFLCLRHLYFVNCKLVFHPYAQFPSCLHAEIIDPSFWTSKYGVKGLVCDKLWAKGKKRKPSDFQNAGNLFCSALDIYVELKKAIQLDASFHDSVARATTWSSPETLARLLWNMPLCIKWLEWLLLQIYQFEIAFLPFCHFPVRKNIVDVVESLYALYKESRFLTKAAIIVAEKIWMDEENGKGDGRCIHHRQLLKFCLEQLIPKMKSFDDGSIYNLLKFVLEEGWTKDERLTGEISPMTSENDFRFVRDGHTADVNIDLCFSNNYRGANYWKKFEEANLIEFTKEQLDEAVTKIEAFKKLMENQSAASKCKKYRPLKYDLQYYKNFIGEMKPANNNKSLVPEDIIRICGLMRQAELVNDSVLYQFNFETMMKINVHLAQGAAEEILGLEALCQLYPLFFMQGFETIVVAMRSIEIHDMLGRFHLLECRRLLADVAGRLCSMLNMFLPLIACPAPKFFILSFTEISKQSRGTAITSIDQAKSLLIKLASSGLVFGEASRTETKSIKDTSLLVDPLKELELKWAELLSEVAKVQYQKLLKEQVKCSKYPQFSLLEYRFVEELAALRKSHDMGHQKAEQRLVQLLSFRLNWLVAEYEQWKGASGEDKTTVPDAIPHKSLVSLAYNLKAKILAVLIQLKSIFYAYLSPFRTTHPFSETSECLLLRLVEVLLVNSENSVTQLPSSQLYSALMSGGVVYLEKLLGDCLEVWSVPELYSDPDIVPEDVLEHAQLVHTAISQLLLVLVDRLQTQCSCEQAVIMQTAFNTLVEAGTLIRLAGLASCANALEQVGGHFLVVYGMLAPLAQALQLSTGVQPSKGGWLGCSKQWLDCVYATKTGCLTRFFERIKFDEFMAKVSDKSLKTVQDNGEGLKKAVNLDSRVKSGAVEGASNCGTVGATTDSSATPIIDVTKQAIDCKGSQPHAEVIGNFLCKTNRDDLESEASKGDGDGSPVKYVGRHEKTIAGPTVDSSASGSLNCCFGCQKREKAQKTFKKCKKCVSEKWTVVRVYCSSHCCAADWDHRHGYEHHAGEQESDYNALDID